MSHVAVSRRRSSSSRGTTMPSPASASDQPGHLGLEGASEERNASAGWQEPLNPTPFCLLDRLMDESHITALPDSPLSIDRPDPPPKRTGALADDARRRGRPQREQRPAKESIVRFAHFAHTRRHTPRRPATASARRFVVFQLADWDANLRHRQTPWTSTDSRNRSRLPQARTAR